MEAIINTKYMPPVDFRRQDVKDIAAEIMLEINIMIAGGVNCRLISSKINISVKFPFNRFQ